VFLLYIIYHKQLFELFIEPLAFESFKWRIFYPDKRNIQLLSERYNHALFIELRRRPSIRSNLVPPSKPTNEARP